MITNLPSIKRCLLFNRPHCPKGTRIPSSKSSRHKKKLDLNFENLELLETQLEQLAAELELDIKPPDPPKATQEKPPSVTSQKEDTSTSKETKQTKTTIPSKFHVQKFRSRRTQRFFSERSFTDLGLDEELKNALEQIDMTKPSQIQAMTLEMFRELGFKRSLLIADQSGSGKTLSYLLPLIYKIKLSEREAGKKLTMSKQARALIVVPTSELAAQVLTLCREISKSCPFRSVAITGGHPWSTQSAFFDEGVDVAICTPKRLLSHLTERTLDLKNCQTIVLDEVDILLGMGPDFREDVMRVLEFVDNESQLFLATATLPSHTYTLLSETFRDLTPVIGPGFHRTAAGVVEQLVDCSGGDIINEETGLKRKLAALSQLIKSNEDPSQRTVIFCNKIDTCRKVENFLKRIDSRTDYVLLPYHSAIEPVKMKKNLKFFLRSTESQHLILIATDRASRGLDTTKVTHVILFDFPRDPSEYVRRVGRTARGANTKGLVSILVLGRQVRQAREVLNKSQKGIPIHKIPQN